MDATGADPALDRLYADFEATGLMPLWTQRGDLMPRRPSPRAVPHVWRRADVYPLAERSGELVPVGRGGERRAIALANPGLPGVPYATPTLWAAIQYLGPDEVAPAHRHSQSAFRFIIEGRGVWTNVDGDPVEMRPGDVLLTPSWAWHEHHNTADAPMTWLDGLDIPLVAQLDAGFFEFGPDEVADRSTPHRSRAERLWAHPGLRPVSASNAPDAPDAVNSPLAAYRWEHTDAALAAQLELAAEGHPGVVGPGHAAVRFSNPTTGRDALPTLRLEMHRFAAGTRAEFGRTVGSSVWQVFSGAGTVRLDGTEFEVVEGDMVAVPSWCPFGVVTGAGMDLFAFSDAPAFEALHLARRAAHDGN
ncbi:cupin domain-containing protein [Streptomyces sp. SID3343]|uniref:cupin domain-containing protein n=1 Tax=Streptomyces sp. SID3343 TaxID=2690260 RepID=UPI00137069CD|nr:cupin domain-containing protein [Streptomyces sp. SID3343]MYW05494.1 cupin domain-containing protein [Streptomyces sp. SID3343]